MEILLKLVLSAQTKSPSQARGTQGKKGKITPTRPVIIKMKQRIADNTVNILPIYEYILSNDSTINHNYHVSHCCALSFDDVINNETKK